MLTHAINAERIKLLSTKSPYWCVAIVALLAVVFSVLIGLSTASSDVADDVRVSDYTNGITQVGIIILMIMAVLAVTSEFRFGTIRTSFQAVPSRGPVMISKAVVYGSLTAAISMILGIVAIALGKVLSGRYSGAVQLGGAEAVRQYWGLPVFTFLCILIGLGVGAIVRQTAGAIVALLLWVLALEAALTNIPKVKVVGPYLPFNNASRFLSDRSNGIDYPWNAYGSLLYFALAAAVVFAVGLRLIKRRDA